MRNVLGRNSAQMSGNEAAPGCSGRLRGSAPADGDPVSFPPNLTAQLRNQRREPDPVLGLVFISPRQTPDVLGSLRLSHEESGSREGDPGRACRDMMDGRTTSWSREPFGQVEGLLPSSRPSRLSPFTENNLSSSHHEGSPLPLAPFPNVPKERARICIRTFS